MEGSIPPQARSWAAPTDARMPRWPSSLSTFRLLSENAVVLGIFTWPMEFCSNGLSREFASQFNTVEASEGTP